jgi:hypothetical protein
MRSSLYFASFALVTVCATSTMRAQEVMNSAHVLTPSEVKELLKGASTPEDHLKIAAYFKQEAVQEDEAASLHDAIAAMPQTPQMVTGMKMNPSETASHCRYFAKIARKAAANDRKLAAYHEQWAETQRTAKPSHVSNR